MSIYSTLWILKFPRFGDDHPGCDWIEVVAQGVHAHVGTSTPGHGYDDGDPYGDFLPPPLPVWEDGGSAAWRAVVIVDRTTEKVLQRYVNPLLVMSGHEYAAATFRELHERICDALRGDRPRFVAETRRDGRITVHFEDGSTHELSDTDRPSDF